MDLKVRIIGIFFLILFEKNGGFNKNMICCKYFVLICRQFVFLVNVEIFGVCVEVMLRYFNLFCVVKWICVKYCYCGMKVKNVIYVMVLLLMI